MTLYEIATEHRAIFDELSESGNFDLQTIEDTLSPITKSFDEKAKIITSYINNTNADIETLKNHEKNIVSRRKSLEGNVEKYRNYIKNNMILGKINSIKSPFFDITLRNSNPSLLIEDELEIPMQYVKTKTVTEVDRPTLKEALMDGFCVPGASLVQNFSLTIKTKGSQEEIED